MTKHNPNHDTQASELNTKDQIAIFSDLLSREWNKVCADCTAKSPTCNFFIIKGLQ